MSEETSDPGVVSENTEMLAGGDLDENHAEGSRAPVCKAPSKATRTTAAIPARTLQALGLTTANSSRESEGEDGDKAGAATAIAQSQAQAQEVVPTRKTATVGAGPAYTDGKQVTRGVLPSSSKETLVC